MSGSAADRTPETARIDPRYLRQVLLWVVDVATMGVKVKGHFPVPASLRPFLRGGRVPSVKYGALARAIESDPAFRGRMAAAATEERVGAIGMVWLTRPNGWQERLIELAAAEDEAAAERTKDEELQRARKRRGIRAELLDLGDGHFELAGAHGEPLAQIDQLGLEARLRVLGRVAALAGAL